LRRVDWRFLAFKPWPGKSITFTNGTLKQAVELISGSTVSPDSAVEGSCDLAVASNPDRNTLELMFSHLKPGGTSYIEWTVSPLVKADSFMQEIESLGFSDVALYLLKPDFKQSQPTMWIPFQNRGAVEYTLLGSYLDDVSVSPLRRIGAQLRILLYRIFPSAFINLPWLIVPHPKNFTVCTIASKPETRSLKKTAVPALRDLPNENVEAEYNLPGMIGSTLESLGQPVPSERTSMLMITRGNTENKKVGLLVFPDQSSEPSFIVKMPRVEKSLNSLKNEGSVLSSLGTEIKWIPRILFSFDEPGYFALGQTLVKGMRIAGKLDSNIFKDLASKMTGWLVELAQKTKTPARKEEAERKIEEAISIFTAYYGSVMTEDEMLRIRAIISRLDLDYTVCEHRDLGPWNILIDTGGTPGIIDWENSSLHGFPFMDLITFFTWAAIYLENADIASKYRVTYRNMLDGSTFAGNIFNECARQYSAELGISSDSIRALRLLNLLIQADQEFPQIKSRVENPLDDENSIENGCNIQLLREEMLSGSGA
jgi:hypothetical protein